MLDKINENLRKNNFRDSQIGHSYFMNGEVQVTQISELQMIFAYSIIPQLRDYFYDDESKIKDILGNSWLHEDGDTKKEWQGADGMDVFYKNIQDLLGE